MYGSHYLGNPEGSEALCQKQRGRPTTYFLVYHNITDAYCEFLMHQYNQEKCAEGKNRPMHQKK